MKTTDTYSFIYNCNLKYGKDYFDFSETEYKGSRQKLKVICKFCGKPIYGFPSQFTSDNRDCDCHRLLTKEKIEQRGHQIHDKLRAEKNLPPFSYEHVNYISKEIPILITCPVIDEKTGEVHGDFPMLTSNHLSHKQGCPKCKHNQISKNQTYTKDQFIAKSIKNHKDKLLQAGIPEYDYSETEYIDSRHDITFKCLLHGSKTQNAGSHMFGTLCDECSRMIVTENQKLTIEQIYEKSKEIYPTRYYTYDKVKFQNIKDEVTVTCPLHGDFPTTLQAHLHYGKECPVCKPHTVSQIEQDIYAILSNNNIQYSTHNRNIISPQELDIYIPSYNIGIEIDGIYWHSDKHKSKDYHINKTNNCEKQGIHLIHIFEDEWLYKHKIVEARLLNLLGKNKFSIGARKLLLKQVPVEQERIFLNNNHLQGYVASQVCYGLYYKTKDNRELLVCLMSFGQLRKNLGSSAKDGVYELYRFVTAKGYSVTGGASKLFKHFIKQFKPKQVVSYADRRWSIKSERNLYERLDFKFDSFTEPTYFYVQGNKRINRFALRKDVLIKEYGCLPTQTEKEFTEQMGWPRIYDCGNLKYIWTNNNK